MLNHTLTLYIDPPTAQLSIQKIKKKLGEGQFQKCCNLGSS